MTGSMILVKTADSIRAAGNQDMVNSLLPVFESAEMRNIKAERDIYKMRVEMHEPKKKAELARAIESARENYAVREPSTFERIVLGGYGLVISATVGLFNGIVNAVNELIYM
jgi:hypothetical protein